MSGTRNPVLAGTWYAADPRQLSRDVDEYLASADATQQPAGRALVAIAPHAGYVYSGLTAGHLYGLLGDPPPARVVILAPNHRTALSRVALSSADAFATPLGDVPLDTDAVARLAAHPGFEINDEAHAAEHAIEIQLPFLQRVWPGARPSIVPLLVPRLSEDVRRTTAAALVDEITDDTLRLVSTDFTHYGAGFGYLPFTKDIPAALERLDTGAVLRILKADAADLSAYGQRTGITMCGLEATALALACGLPQGYEAALLAYRRSGDADGDYSLSVSYASILLSSGPGRSDPPAPGGPT